MLNLYTKIPIRYRLALTLVFIMTGAILLADWAGLMTSGRHELMRGRVALVESLAVSGTAMIAGDNDQAFEASIRALVDRNASLDSVRLINPTGEVQFETEGHDSAWSGEPSVMESNLEVPIFQYGQPWGRLQVAFQDTSTELGWSRFGVWGLLAALAPLCFLQFNFFLKRMVEALNPQGAVPENVRMLLDTFAEALVLIDDKKRILLVNSRLCQLLDKSSEELVGRPIDILDVEVADEKTELPWDEAMRSEQPVSERIVRLYRELPGGLKVATFSVNCNPFPGQGLMATLDDVTELEDNKAKLAVALGIAKDASEAKSAFLANMSHEIRTPLNAVLGFTDVLRRGLVSDTNEAVDHLNMIHRSGAHLLELINDILDLSKIEAGRMQVEMLPTAVDQVIADAVNVQHGRAEEKQLELKIEFETGIPTKVACDPTRMRQIITNLVGNAIKFTTKGSVSVKTRCEPIGQAEGSLSETPNHSHQLIIDVVDTGIGMTPAQQDRIFESFVQADSSTTRKFGGTGLGLSISRHLTEAMGGELIVQSRAGIGSTFSVSLPVCADDAATWTTRDEVQQSTRKLNSSKVSGELRRLPAKSVLVVDDGEANRRLIELVLGRAGAKVQSATNGQEAIDAIEQHAFDLVFMDMQMPVMDGMTATEKLREEDCQIPIVALTGNAMKGDREKCIAAGCNEFLSKPVNLDRLLDVTAHFLGAPDTGPSGDASELPKQPETTTAQRSVVAANSDALHCVADLSNQSDLSDPAPIHSALPIDDDEMRSVVIGFLDRLDGRLDGIQAAIDEANFDVVQSEAHWLKGSGGTVGFAEFTVPAKDLENAAKSNDLATANSILGQIQSIRSRIVAPTLSGTPVAMSPLVSSAPAELPSDVVQENPQAATSNEADESIHCQLPMDDDDYREIVIDFVERLDVRLMGMVSLVKKKSFEELGNEAHWLKGAGGTVGFPALTQPATDLMKAARENEAEASQNALRALLCVRQRMVVPVKQRA